MTIRATATAASTVLAAALVLGGCSSSGSSDGPAPDVTATSSQRAELERQASEQAEQTKDASDQLAAEVEKAAERDAGVVVTIVIKDGKVTPQGRRVDVKVGQRVFLDVTSDADEEIHVHSEPEHTYEVAAGGSISESFTVDTPGQVAVEAHHLDATIVQLVVRP